MTIKLGGIDVAVPIPSEPLDLSGMPGLNVHLDTTSYDLIYAIVAPALLALLAVPFVVMRAAMMELDCFLTRRKEVDPEAKVKIAGQLEEDDEADETDFAFYVDEKGRTKRALPASRVHRSLKRAVKENAENKELKARLYVTVCCSVFGMCVFTLMMILAGAFLTVQFH